VGVLPPLSGFDFGLQGLAGERLRAASRRQGQTVPKMRQAVMNASAFARLPSSSYEALSSYAARTWASVELLLSVAIT